VELVPWRTGVRRYETGAAQAGCGRADDFCPPAGFFFSPETFFPCRSYMLMKGLSQTDRGDTT
jgi:hypothetical protein